MNNDATKPYRMKRKEKILQILESNPGGLSPTIIGMNMGYDIKNASNNIQEPLSALVSHGKVIKQKTYGGVIFKLNKPMNENTIKAAEEYASPNRPIQTPMAIARKEAFLAGSEHMQAQKDEQIKELVEAMQEFTEAIESEEIIIKENFDNDGYENCGGRLYQIYKQLIQKYKG